MDPKALPNLGQIPDIQTQQALRILWDRLQSCQEGLRICQGVRKSLQSRAKELQALGKETIRFEARLRG